MPNHLPPPKSRCCHKLYELTCEDYDALVDHAGGVCQICGARPEETGHGFLVVDHDAMVGPWAVRGLLCSDCNTQIPAGSSPSWAHAYLADPWWRRAHLDERRQGSAEAAVARSEAIAAVAAASADYEAARAELTGAILEALRQPDAKPTKVAAASPWTPAYVRAFARKHGIGPDPSYKDRTRKAADQ